MALHTWILQCLITALWKNNARMWLSNLQTLTIFSGDIEMQFGISKRAMLKMKRGKVVQSEEIVFLGGEMIKAVKDEQGYKYLGVAI